MIVFLNGKFVPDEQAVVSVFDRGFLLGDGVFETVPIHGGRPFCWAQHLTRLVAGAGCLGLRLPFSVQALAGAVDELVARNRLIEAVLRITLTRGSGSRGYSPRCEGPTTLVMASHPSAAMNRSAPPQWRLTTATVRVPSGEALAFCKHASRVQYVMARAEAEARGFDDALLLNAEGLVAEAASGNVFWIERQTLFTSPLSSGALAGITRSLIVGLAGELGVPTQFSLVGTDVLRRAEGAFVTLSTLGVVEITALDGEQIAESEITARLRDAYRDGVDAFRAGSGSALDRLCVFPPRA